MKRVLAALLACAAIGAQAQSLSGPESVEFHPRTGRLLISNTSGGNIIARSSTGVLSEFTADPNSPYGIELLGGVLYVLDSGFLRGYDIDSAQRVVNLQIANASFLNGITSDGVSKLYISDFSSTPKKIVVVDVANIAAPAQSLLVNLPTSPATTPNGLVYDRANQRLLIATWGAARVLSYDLVAGGAPTTLINVTGYNNIDGIALDCNGAIHIAPWSCPGGGGCLRRLDPPFTLTSTPIAEGAALSAPADIDFGERTGEIAIPESSANRVAFVQTSCAASIFADGFER
jgi:sugar lactone lactonase YvrE